MVSDETVRQVMFYTALEPGNLMLCECADGQIRLFRDDHPVPGHAWRASAVARAIEAYQEMRAVLTETTDR